MAELIDNDHLANDSDAPFGPESLLEVAEIGLAAADTRATRAVIQEALSAGVLWGGDDGSLLTAVGDDHGVVIVAPTAVAGSRSDFPHSRYRRRSSQLPLGRRWSNSPKARTPSAPTQGAGESSDGASLEAREPPGRHTNPNERLTGAQAGAFSRSSIR